MAILRLRDEGKLSLDDPAERYVPELKDAQVSDDGFASNYGSSSVVARGRLSRRQPVGRSAAGEDRQPDVGR